MYIVVDQTTPKDVVALATGDQIEAEEYAVKYDPSHFNMRIICLSPGDTIVPGANERFPGKVIF